MKFTTSIVALGLAVQAMATPTVVERKATLAQRDLAAFQSVLSGIQDQVKSFDTAITGYSGGDTTALLAAASKITTTTNSGVSSLSSEATLSESDALQLTSPVQDLTSTINTAISDLISKKSQLVAAGQGATVETNLQGQYDAAKKLADTISGKVPSALSGVAATLASGITAAIQKGIDAFKGTGGSTGSATSATATATSAPGSTAPASTAPGSTAPGTTAHGSTATASATSPAGSSSVVPGSGTATSSGLVPGSGTTGTSTSPAFTNLASGNKVNTVGLLAAVAALFAF
ncbi:hydrophobic surface binding protein A-domain-containing protein [Talaromyces proteolyticus]|uniref:Cell wall mannoprotein 1 n=1 Tax=Talaromyces proteolyticus TaxID=1131652 RepID=A0AAD4KKC1_9EURO|nr:hydrophobic surface binding protein A-domain-containing protein [Talaromyces proteolyticus]KAH8692228.1 hydrophobic surface binding protein A-domain-containing protein [Talaromyces proteolyticus]